jgi:polysaccharide export outer membrane protein
MVRTILALMMIGLMGSSTPAHAEGLSGSAPSPAAASVEQSYRIGPGDVLDVSVWKDEALTRSCVVRPDGFISFPLIGDVPVSGKTVFGLKSEMEDKLRRFVPEVVLYLDVKQVNSLIIYVIGKVNNPGRFTLGVDVDVLQALATAGGLNVFAKGGKIKIFRLGKNETTIFPFDYDAVVDGKHLEQNIYLKRGDVVVVP